ncbi:MAG: MscL family protein [Candidatus Shapirobacteria bacterium]
MKGFLEFVRKQGVVGLAVGFILGGSVKEVVSALIEDIINPVLGVLLGSTKGLASASLKLGPLELLWGHFVSVLIDFLVVAFVVYFGIKGLGLEKLDKKKK